MEVLISNTFFFALINPSPTQIIVSPSSCPRVYSVLRRRNTKRASSFFSKVFFPEALIDIMI